MMHYTCEAHQQSKESNIKYLVREVGKQNQNNSSATEREELEWIGLYKTYSVQHIHKNNTYHIIIGWVGNKEQLDWLITGAV